ncbi:ZZ-type zinc finger-containing protein 3 isoform X2 [Phyllopteryx taeniolatus]|uniref:ZZ-type zinc finger-containing protein 3 isoform X2 n=1 Tax=Phyllopteryx taeniolatus TaxID=161469 RepID=UPI002AD26083|nr:ZZ-type zinc finger-containing protein 3 isoform X2 [Phyllopteryx taeniolatus]
MAASRSSRVTRSSVGLNGLDENFCGRTLRNRSIAQPDETAVSPLPRARSPKKRQESRQDSRQVSKQDVKQGSKKEDKQESKPDPKKEKTKQEAKEDTENESIQDSDQQVLLQGRFNDSKDSNSYLEAEQEPSAGPRKRSSSCLENDVSPEKSEHCDKGNGVPDAPPLIKRAKRCSRAGESQGHEEDAVSPKSAVSVPERCKGDTCEDIPTRNSTLAPASPVLGEEEGELVKDGRMKCEGAPLSPDAHKASNGLGDVAAEKHSTLVEESPSPASATSCLTLLNGGQAGAPPSPHPTVPCTNSSPVHTEVAASGESSASFSPAPPEDPLPELMVAREQEVEDVEVDVVGDPLCLAAEEQVMDSECDANGRLLTPVPDAAAAAAASPSSAAYNNNSGETTPPLAPTPPPTKPGCTPLSFAELYEHRYTLRTSPRKTSSTKTCSPPRDNGPLREDRESVEGMDEDFPLPSDSLCPPDNEETTCVGPRDEKACDDGGPVLGPDVCKEAACSHTTEEEEEGEEEEEEEEEEPDVYYFESDHLALKHNKDYQRLLQTIGVLEAQRAQAILDLETLARHQREALADPISFVEQLQKRMIRGRLCQSSKPHTFNQLWTAEEQKKLEQLLLKFPPEEVESKRWQKIADELGNRTAKQVASRVQKYFIKLTKAGIPVPGRTPNLYMYTKKASSKRQHHLNKHLFRPSTFLTSYEPPVFMDDDDEERAVFYSAMHDPTADDSDEDGVPAELRNLPEYKELVELKRLKKQKIQEIREDKGGVQHLGYKCDVCGMDPIQGVRWHCQDCPQDNAVDFCANCSDCLFKTETHKPNHHLDPVYQPETFLDRDYRLPQSTSYNYLDPNYFPANR